MRRGKFPTPEEDHEELIELVTQLAMLDDVQGPRRAVTNLLDELKWWKGQAGIYRDAYLKSRVETDPETKLCS